MARLIPISLSFPWRPGGYGCGGQAVLDHNLRVSSRGAKMVFRRKDSDVRRSITPGKVRRRSPGRLDYSASVRTGGQVLGCGYAAPRSLHPLRPLRIFCRRGRAHRLAAGLALADGGLARPPRSVAAGAGSSRPAHPARLHPRSEEHAAQRQESQPGPQRSVHPPRPAAGDHRSGRFNQTG